MQLNGILHKYITYLPFRILFIQDAIFKNVEYFRYSQQDLQILSSFGKSCMCAILVSLLLNICRYFQKNEVNKAKLVKSKAASSI